MKKSAIFFSMFLALGMATQARAARTAVIDVDKTELFRGPQSDSQVLTYLKKGQHVTASNYPTEGYYKVRTIDGTLGWVKANTLELGPMPDLKSSK